MEFHEGLSRQGPGEPADVHWAISHAKTPTDALILDAACGTGADLPAFLDALPECHVTAVDQHAPFLETIAASQPSDRVTVRQGDMLDVRGPFDLIWCAGAIYLKGVGPALSAWASALKPDGAIAFSSPCFLSDTPSDEARAFWGDDPVFTKKDMLQQADAADFSVQDTRIISDAAWDAYYQPVHVRAEILRENQRFSAVCQSMENDARTFSRIKHETGYLLVLARPK